MSFIVGLTGGIGSGKSAAAEVFAGLGAVIVDVDRIAHDLTLPGGAAMPAIRNCFGESFVDASGALDRQAMRALVFTDPAAKTKLEGVLHPMVRQESIRLCGQATDGPYVVMVVPLLVETGTYRDCCDRVAVVDCDEATQLARVMARSGLGADEVRRIMAVQASRGARLAIADDVIDNNGGLPELHARIGALHGRYAALARAKPRPG